MVRFKGVKMARKTDKQRYRIRNWAAYNEALVQRGSITLWFDEASLSRWYGNERAGKPGRPTVYSDWTIQTALVLRAVFHLPFRALEGFVRSVMALMGKTLSVPDFSTFSRRQQTLKVTIPRRIVPGEPLHIAIDSSGLKIYGEGKWQHRVHEEGQRRLRKRHLTVDTASKQVVACELTADFVTDDHVLPDLLGQMPEETIATVAADGAYDTRNCHGHIAARGAKALIPPRENAVEWEPDHPRTQIVQAIQTRGRKGWKQASGYHRRSLAENAFFRLKTLFGPRLRNRTFRAQCTEAYCRIAASTG